MVALLLCGMLLAQEIILSLSADRIAMGQVTELSIDFINIDDVSPPHFPKDGGLSVELQNKNPEQNFVYQNGRSRHTLRYRYIVLGVAQGNWNIGPVSIVHEGKSHVSNGVSVTVFRSGQEATKRTTVEGVLSKEAPYAGEVLSHHVRFSLRDDGIRKEIIPSEYVGLSSIAAPHQESSHVWEDKKLVEVLDIWFPLRALNEARYEISSSKVLLETRVENRDLPTSFFQERVEKQYFLSDPSMGVIRPLPSAPANFSGLVGSFQFRAYPRKKMVQVEEPVEIVMELWGSGLLSGYRVPGFSDDRFEVFDEHPQEKEEFLEGAYTSKWTMKRTLLPVEAGTHAVEPFSIVIFDPLLEKYVELRSDPMVLRVQGEVQHPAGNEDAKIEKKEMMNPPWVEDLPEHRSVSIPPWWSSWVLCVIPIVWWYRKREKKPSHLPFPLSLPEEPEERWRHLEQFMQQYILHCSDHGLPYDHEKVGKAKKALYAARYGGADAEDVDRIVRAALS